MARSTKDDALETRERIIDAAEDVFHAKGVSRTSLADVAQAAGVTRGAIYWHFKNKSDLFNAMCERFRLPVEEVMFASLEDGVKDPLSALFTGLVSALQEASRNPRWYRALDVLFNKCELVEADDPILMRHYECRGEVQEKVCRIFRAAKANGQLHADFNVAMGERFLHATITGMIQNWVFEKDSDVDFAVTVECVLGGCLYTLQHAPALRCR